MRLLIHMSQWEHLRCLARKLSPSEEKVNLNQQMTVSPRLLPHLRLHLTRLLGTFDLALVQAQMPMARQSLQPSKIWNPSQRGAAPVTCLIPTPTTTMGLHGLSWTQMTRMMTPQMRTRRQAGQ
jgi:hypothetical protein